MRPLNPDPEKLSSRRESLIRFIRSKFPTFVYHRNFDEPSDYGTDYGNDYFTEFVTSDHEGHQILVQLYRTADDEIEFYVSQPNIPSVPDGDRIFSDFPEALEDMANYIRRAQNGS